MIRRWPKAITLAVATGTIAALIGATSGCSALRYYHQAVSGHFEVLNRAESVAQRLNDPALDPRLRERLELSQRLRDFATRELKLPDNASYRKYADLGRSYVIWNVVAADEFSVKPKESCFPVAGCVAYRGFYGEADAKRFGDEMAANDADVFVYGVAAYSTLGWFSDPLLNTFINYPDAELARLIFHEVAHQQLYLAGDSVFNESFATAVEEEGVRRWIAADGNAAMRAAFDAGQIRRRHFVELVLRYQQRLDALYRAGGEPAAMRVAKAQAFAELRAHYERMKRDQWNGFSGYDRWFAQGLNNAHLASVSTYTQWVPAFAALIAQSGGDMTAFYKEAADISRLDSQTREARLQALSRPQP